MRIEEDGRRELQKGGAHYQNELPEACLECQDWLRKAGLTSRRARPDSSG